MFRMLKNNKGFWQVAAPILASMGGSALSSLMGQGESGSQGYDLPMLTNAPWDYTNQQMTAQAAQDQLRNAQMGRLPPGMEILLANMKKQQLQQGKEQMFGTPGRRGGSIMDITEANAAKGGVGPKALMSQSSKALGDYASRNSQIQNYIDGLKYTGLQNSQNQAIQQMQAMPRSQEIPYTGHVVPMGQAPQQGMDTGLQNVDWSSLMSGMFNKKDPSGGGGYLTGNTVNSGGQNYPITVPPQRILSQYDSLGRRY